MQQQAVWIVRCEVAGGKMNWEENFIGQMALTKAMPIVLNSKTEQHKR